MLDLYDENEALEIDTFREAGIDVIKKAIESYKQQITDFEKFPESTDIGLFQLDTKELKAMLKPSPQRCLNKLEELLPKLSFQRSKVLVEELQFANRKLAVAPSDIYEYIEYSKFLKETDEKMNEYGSRFSDVKDMNLLMEQYNIRIGEDANSKF